MNLPDGFFWYIGGALLLSAGACYAMERICRHRHLALKQELTRISEDLMQMVELQMDSYRQVRRSLGDIEEKVLDLAVPSTDMALPLERRHQVLALTRKGVPIDEIARRLHMPKGEAELILSLRRFAGAKAAPEPSPGDLKGYRQAPG